MQDLPVILKWHNFQSLEKALDRRKKCNRRPIITSVQCTYLNIFFSETTRLIELKFYMEYALEKNNILHFVSGNLTKMGTVSIYCKNLLNFVLLNQKANYSWSVA